MQMSQREIDHSAPFRDVFGESSGERIQRVAGIGRARLLDWWSRFGRYTHPATYGQCDCTFAGSVAYELETGARAKRPLISQISAYDYDVLFAVKLLNEARAEAA